MREGVGVRERDRRGSHSSRPCAGAAAAGATPSTSTGRRHGLRYAGHGRAYAPRQAPRLGGRAGAHRSSSPRRACTTGCRHLLVRADACRTARPARATRTKTKGAGRPNSGLAASRARRSLGEGGRSGCATAGHRPALGRAPRRWRPASPVLSQRTRPLACARPRPPISPWHAPPHSLSHTHTLPAPQIIPACKQGAPRPALKHGDAGPPARGPFGRRRRGGRPEGGRPHAAVKLSRAGSLERGGWRVDEGAARARTRVRERPAGANPISQRARSLLSLTISQVVAAATRRPGRAAARRMPSAWGRGLRANFMSGRV